MGGDQGLEQDPGASIERVVEWAHTDASGHHHNSAVVRWVGAQPYGPPTGGLAAGGTGTTVHVPPGADASAPWPEAPRGAFAGALR